MALTASRRALIWFVFGVAINQRQGRELLALVILEMIS